MHTYELSALPANARVACVRFAPDDVSHYVPRFRLDDDDEEDEDDDDDDDEDFDDEEEGDEDGDEDGEPEEWSVAPR